MGPMPRDGQSLGDGMRVPAGVVGTTRLPPGGTRQPGHPDGHLPPAAAPTTIRSGRYRVRFDSRRQAELCAQTAGANRYVWNLFLREFQAFLAAPAGAVYADQDLSWLRDPPSAPVRHVPKYLDAACRRFHKAHAKAKAEGRFLPRRKSRQGHKANGFTIPDQVRMDGHRLHIPRLGWVRLERGANHPYRGCAAKTVRLLKEGTDRHPKWTPTSSASSAGRPRPGNAAHRHSRKRADTAHAAVVEDLNVQAMTQSAQGTVEKPGTNVQAQSGLNREILASGWGRLERNPDHQAGPVVKVDPAHTSPTCAVCGHAGQAKRKTQAAFKCTACGHTANAVRNAAVNILTRDRPLVRPARGAGASARRGAFPAGTPPVRPGPDGPDRVSNVNYSI